MSYTHARRCGATVLFRRKIPVDLRDRFGSHEIVRSIGHASPGEVRRIVHRLWSQTEIVFMHVRQDPHLKREEIGKVVAMAVGQFDDGVDLRIADVRPRMTMEPFDEPIDRAAHTRGQAAHYGDNLQSLFDQLVPVAKISPKRDPSTPSIYPASITLLNADVPFSALWSTFRDNKILIEERLATEAKTNGLTIRLWPQCCGDRSPREYTCENASRFHGMIKKLPSSYCHSGKYWKIYENQSALAVVAMSKGDNVKRISKKNLEKQ